MKRLNAIMTMCCLSCAVCAQDIHFSQFTEAPLTVNPALTGVFNGDVRVILNYKDQWRSIASPYTTYALSADAGLFKKKWDKSFLGAGLFLYRDQAGEVQMSTTRINASLSGIVSISEKQKLSAGIQGGFAQRSIDPSNMQWDSQFDGQGYSASLPSNETFDFSASTGFTDLAGGIDWNYLNEESNMISNDMFYANVGASYAHITQPELFSFAGQDRLYSRITAHGNAYIGLKNSGVALLPSALFYIQGPHKEILTGMMVRYLLKEESKYTEAFKGTAISLGAMYRVGDAAIPTVYMELGSFGIGVSYDVNISTLKAATSARGGLEFSLRFINPNPFKGSESNVRFL